LDHVRQLRDDVERFAAEHAVRRGADIAPDCMPAPNERDVLPTQTRGCYGAHEIGHASGRASTPDIAILTLAQLCALSSHAAFMLMREGAGTPAARLPRCCRRSKPAANRCSPTGIPARNGSPPRAVGLA
jgi:hypothetical protein